MLKQILADMCIDPDLLAELSEEQKQILFFKMRQEQVRRWKERETAIDKSSTKKPAPRRGKGKSVKWKLGADSEVWVWVMGEHKLDKPYDMICDQILAERAQRQPKEESSPWNTLVLPCDQVLPVIMYRVRGKEENPSYFTEDFKTHPQYPQNKLRSEVSRKRGQALTRSLFSRRKQQGGIQETPNRKKRWPLTVNQTSSLSLPVRKSKAADERRRSIARHARDDYRRLSLQGVQKSKRAEALKKVQDGKQGQPSHPPLPPKPKILNDGVVRKRGVQRTISSSTEEGIIRWFKEEQYPLRAGYEKSADSIAPWFHGIVTSKKAEELLSKSVPGSFLVRISEKIKGYVLSYLSVEGCKHFLIDASSDSYSFLGVDQLQHSTLADLIDYHKEEPITSLGRELLLYPCGQQDHEPDYLDLFE
uniref:SH2 domain containing 4A n=1 Tax=Crocodylus porosus TaxID=8502 RepID=A0A7M4EG74_CROPO